MPYRRSIFLINKRFQYRFAFYTCSWLFALSIAYPLVIYSLFDFVFSLLGGDPSGPQLLALQQTRKDMVWLLVLFQALFMIVTFAISIFMSHRIAGPLYKLGMFLREARNGTFQVLRFRKNDHFKELEDDYNAMILGLQSRKEKADESVGAALKHVERALEKVSDANAKRELEGAAAALRSLSL